MPATAGHPPANRRQLQQIIADSTEGVVLMDTDGTIVGANAAALEMHACQTHKQLGGTARGYSRRFKLRYLNNHSLPARQYPLARLLAGEAVVDTKLEVHKRGDTDFRRLQLVRGVSLSNAQDEVELLALVIKDITDWLTAEERFERTFAANPAPAVILRLSDGRYIKANQGFFIMTTLGRDAILNHAFRDFDILRQAEYRDEALAAMRAHRTVKQQEAILQLPRGDEKFVIVAGQPIDYGEEACMLFTFNDLDPRKQAELSLRHSEERFAQAFRLAPVPMLMCSLKTSQIIEANDAFVAVMGYTRTDMRKHTLSDLGRAEAAPGLRQLRAALAENPTIRKREVQIRTHKNVRVDCLLAAEPVTLQGEACVLCVLQDITERKRSEADLLAAIETVMKDTTWFSHTVMEKLAEIRQPGTPLGKELDALTRREREVLEHMCQGQTNAEIAASLKLSTHTIRNHVAALYDKLGVNRRSAAVIWGRERGLATY